MLLVLFIALFANQLLRGCLVPPVARDVSLREYTDVLHVEQGRILKGGQQPVVAHVLLAHGRNGRHPLAHPVQVSQ